MKKVLFTITGLAGFCAAFGTAANGVFNGLTLLGIIVITASYAAIDRAGSPKPCTAGSRHTNTCTANV